MKTYVQEPKVDIYESEKSFYLKADMPGLDEKDLDIELEGKILKISGLHETSHEHLPNKSYAVKYELGDKVYGENIKANLKEGILTLVLPKYEKAKSKIKIHVA